MASQKQHNATAARLTALTYSCPVEIWSLGRGYRKPRVWTHRGTWMDDGPDAALRARNAMLNAGWKLEETIYPDLD